MTIKKTKTPYEIMFRLDNAGLVSGCHRRDIEIIQDTETGEIYSAKELDPQAIAGTEMDAAIGQINTALTKSLHDVSNNFAACERAHNEASEKIEELKRSVADLTEKLDLADKKIKEKDSLIIDQENRLNAAFVNEERLTEKAEELTAKLDFAGQVLEQNELIIADLKSKLNSDKKSGGAEDNVK